MFWGFYNLASGMLTQNRNLDVISNNMVNISTPGYKRDAYMATTFQDEIFYRMGNLDRTDQQQLGTVSMARVGDETVTSFDQGVPKATNAPLDFAIKGDGFFKIARPEGGFCYTRNGSFMIDEEGYLVLKGAGRVQGEGGDIYFDSDDLSFDQEGNIYDQYGDLIETFSLVDFADYGQLVKGANSTFTTAQQEEEIEEPKVMNGYLEQSNVEPIREMTEMITSQRSIQSAAQLLKMYDQIMSSAVTEIGRVV